ncbi:SDR family NAD(P)-dependent oxidoreductase [Iamia majanohamensis]|uniref:SDR family NAD(P)-dependent oxidoreductase n=1 Tax=Iamia majanohamensis TaxID=467976 RepID=A0AAE9Y893_9ACTN|nr:SDR family NAD(P)-dependent oxidoreductase [Iamia majanohamensis]WCO68397.1 SDR family NAD(P)-dependent oxidoreductase [Iamia majanohamensis]
MPARPGPDALPDLSGRTVVVTGANAGLGKETVVALAGAGAQVLLCARDAGRGAAAAEEARRRSDGGDVAVAELDLGSVASIHAFAERVAADHDRLDVLVNNAGLSRDEREETVDGLEAVVGVNHLGHHLLARLLADHLAATPGSRVVTVASVAHRRVLRPLTRAALEGRDGEYDTFVQYARSKLANVVFTREAARRLGPRGVTAVCCHPGLVRTGMTTEASETETGQRTMALASRLMKDPVEGCGAQVALAAVPDVGLLQGAYVVRGRARRPSRVACDAAHARWLWDESDAMLAEAGARV